MNPTSAILVSIGAAVGSLFRYGAGRFITSRVKSVFPWGTWWINMVGTLLLGVFFRELDIVHHQLDWWILLGTGVCGGFTTFSTMSVEARQLMKDHRVLAIVYLASSLGLGFLIAYGSQWV